MPGDNEKSKEENIATEVLREVKARAKRWMIALLIVLALWAGTIASLVWYMCRNNF